MTEVPDRIGGWVPPGDPTARTNEAVDRATESFRRDMAAVQKLIETRLDSMDKATELLAATLNHVPTETDKAVAALKDLLGARIDGMDTATKLLADSVGQIPSETDKRLAALRTILTGEIHSVEAVAQEKFAAIDGTFGSNALALTAALAAQKEAAAEQNKSNTLAITKSEQATKETILANAAQTASQLASLVATIADLKDRLVRLEAGGLATAVTRSELREGRTESREGINQRLIMLGVAVSVIIIVVNIVIAVVIHHP